MRNYDKKDTFFCLLDNFLKTISGNLSGTGRPNPGEDAEGLSQQSKNDRVFSGELMRINHSGEVAAQALYQGQLFFETDAQMIDYLTKAAEEEADHLIWTSAQIKSLNARQSYLNVVWYFGAFFLGATASLYGEKISRGFLAETEKQVAEHLESHLSLLPTDDKSSRRVVEFMLEDESAHAEWAENSENYTELNPLLKFMMKQGSKIMINVAQKI